MAVENTKFKPKLSSNIIEGATPLEEVADEVTDDKKEDTPKIKGVAVKEVKEVEDKKEPVDETKEPKKEDTPTVSFDTKEVRNTIERNVKICPKVNHTCVIGGVPYHLEKGKQVNVPLNVKTILMKADLLMPL